MGMNIGRNLVGNLPQMNKAVTDNVEKDKCKVNTLKKPEVFPEKPNVQIGYASLDTLVNAHNNGVDVLNATVMVLQTEYKIAGIATNHQDGSITFSLHPTDGRGGNIYITIENVAQAEQSGIKKDFDTLRINDTQFPGKPNVQIGYASLDTLVNAHNNGVDVLNATVMVLQTEYKIAGIATNHQDGSITFSLHPTDGRGGNIYITIEQ